jgi:hypothetical protein
MKKTYIQPSIEAVKIQNAIMQAVSGQLSVKKGAQAGTGDWNGTIQSIDSDFGEVED